MKVKEVWHDTYVEGFHAGRNLLIPRKEVRMLYHLNYWDGALSGVCEWRGRRYYFNCMLDERVTVEEEPGDPEYVDPTGPVPDDWKWIFDYGYKNLADMEDLNEDYYGFRYMALFDLSPAEWEAEDERHAAWRKYIGHHCDYDKNEKRSVKGQVGAEAGGGCNWNAYNTLKKSLPSFPKETILKRPIRGYWIYGYDEKVWSLAQEWKVKNSVDKAR